MLVASLPNASLGEWSFWSDSRLTIGVQAERSRTEMRPGRVGRDQDRYVVFLAGSIYNENELRNFQSAYSDIEPSGTVSVLVDSLGLGRTLREIDGKFALAIWDVEKKALHLASDRIGQVTLYYGWLNGAFVFSSMLAVFPRIAQLEIDRTVLTLYMRHGWIPAPYTIYKGIHKMPAGTVLSVHDSRLDVRPQPEPYWSMKNDLILSGSRLSKVDISEAVERCHDLLTDAVRRRLRDDGIGTLLSAGIDSATITALAQSLRSQPIKTFTIGFGKSDNSETVQARHIASHLGTEHTELHILGRDALQVIPALPLVYEQPFADASQVPTLIACQLAGKSVSVLLTGDGGDEVFVGYNRYFWGSKIWDRISRYPKMARGVLSRVIRLFSPEQWNTLFKMIAWILPDRYIVNNPGHKLHKLAGVFGVESVEELYHQLVSQWHAPELILRGAIEPLTAITNREGSSVVRHPIDYMMYLDTITYLPDDVLVKVGKAASSVGIEVRAPFLANGIVEYAWSLPLELHVQGLEGKQILRQILYRYVPRELMNRPKTGFGPPLGEWLRGPLREWAESLLEAQRLRDEGYFQVEYVRRIWNEHLNGKRDISHQLWNVLMFQAWLDASKR